MLQQAKTIFEFLKREGERGGGEGGERIAEFQRKELYKKELSY